VQLVEKYLKLGFRLLRTFYRRLKFRSLLAGSLHRYGLVEIFESVVFFDSGGTAISGKAASADSTTVALGGGCQGKR
jgi:hypothetical protein